MTIWKKVIKALPLMMLLACENGTAQEPKGLAMDPEFDKKVNSLLDYTVPVIGVEELHANMDKYIILDAREAEEYGVSHIPGARYIGYNDFSGGALKDLDTSKPVVVYCSVGYRSEKIGEKLEEMGFGEVYNLYGSIFEWANRGYPVIDVEGDRTNAVHGYNKKWSKWLDGSKVRKVW